MNVAFRGGFGETQFPGHVGFALMLWRLSCRTTLLRDRLAWAISESTICEVFNRMIVVMYVKWSYLVLDLQVDPILAKIFCGAIKDKGAPMPKCFAFLDGTLRKVARPVRKQQVLYNGWKRYHALKYQSVETPDGIHRHLWGPEAGRRHDSTMLADSGLEDTLMHNFNDHNGEAWYLFADAGYALSPWIMTPYKGNLNAGQRLFNKDFSKVRVAVEWGFGRIVALFPFIDSPKQQQVLLSSCGLGRQFIVAGFLTNCRTCFYGNTTSKRFDVSPPSIVDYVNGDG